MASILVIDDEQPIRLVLRQMLQREGHVVSEAQDGEEGIAAFRSCPSDLVITDILMPKKGGLVAISEIRKAFPDVPILAISGGGKEGKLNFLSTARTFDGVKALRKPFTRDELLAAVKELLGGA